MKKQQRTNGKDNQSHSKCSPEELWTLALYVQMICQIWAYLHTNRWYNCLNLFSYLSCFCYGCWCFPICFPICNGYEYGQDFWRCMI